MAQVKENNWFTKRKRGASKPTQHFIFPQDFYEKQTSLSRAEWVPVYSDRGRLSVNFNLLLSSPVDDIASQKCLNQQLKELFGARKTADQKEYFSVVTDSGGSKAKGGYSCINVQWYCLCPMPTNEQMFKFREIVEGSMVPATFVRIDAKTGEMEAYEFEELPEDYDTRRRILRMCRGGKCTYGDRKNTKRPTIAGAWWRFKV